MFEFRSRHCQLYYGTADLSLLYYDQRQTSFMYENSVNIEVLLLNE